MIQNEICPNCRSTYQISGRLDFGAPSLQVVNCPVCSQEKWIPSGIFPQRWVVGQVIDRQPVPGPAVPIPKPDDIDPVWDITIPGQDAIVAAGQGIYKIGIWIIVVLVLVILIQYEPYFRRS